MKIKQFVYSKGTDQRDEKNKIKTQYYIYYYNR